MNKGAPLLTQAEGLFFALFAISAPHANSGDSEAISSPLPNTY